MGPRSEVVAIRQGTGKRSSGPRPRPRGSGRGRAGSNAALTRKAYARGLRVLSRRDPDLRRVLERLGPPPMWTRDPGFPALLRIILEQQVSLASARAAYDRLVAAAAPLSPETFLQHDDAALKTFGFSWQKTAYGPLAGPVDRRASSRPGRAGRNGGRRRPVPTDGDQGDRALDGGHLSADGASPARRVAQGGPGPGRARRGRSSACDPSPIRGRSSGSPRAGGRGGRWPLGFSGIIT